MKNVISFHLSGRMTSTSSVTRKCYTTFCRTVLAAALGTEQTSAVFKFSIKGVLKIFWEKS